MRTKRRSSIVIVQNVSKYASSQFSCFAEGLRRPLRQKCQGGARVLSSWTARHTNLDFWQPDDLRSQRPLQRVLPAVPGMPEISLAATASTAFEPIWLRTLLSVPASAPEPENELATQARPIALWQAESSEVGA
jgi:hypothetical protein